MSRIFRWVASRFRLSKVSDFRFDVDVADISGDLAYTVGHDASTRPSTVAPVAPVTVRVTHVWRRENGEWKIVHRHRDIAPIDQTQPPRRRQSKRSAKSTRSPVSCKQASGGSWCSVHARPRIQANPDGCLCGDLSQEIPAECHRADRDRQYEQSLD